MRDGPPSEWEGAYTRRTMQRLQEFQVAAREGGFVQVEECEAGTVLWLRKEAADPDTKTHQRICIDSLSDNITIYWMTVGEKIESKRFHSVASLKEWFALHACPLSGSNDKS